MSPAVALLSLGATGMAFALGLALGRRLISAMLLAQAIGGLGCGLLVVLAATRLFSGGWHG